MPSPLITSDEGLKLILAGTHADLARLVRDMAEAAGQLAAKRGVG
jgi:hypothetical protein